jgi:hypothetical protein
MAGYDNIKDHGFDKRTTEEQRQIAIKGGKASGKARRRKADFRKTLNQLLTTRIENPNITPLLDEIGIDSTLEAAMLMAQIKEAMQGNTKAAYFVAQYAGQSSRSDDEAKNLKADTELKQARKKATTGENETDEALERLDQILGEIRKNANDTEAE